MSGRIEGPARLAVAAFWFATAAYALVASIPFAYQNFIQPRLLPDVMRFAERHAWLAALLWPAAWLALRPALADPRSKPIARVILAGWGALAVLLPGLPSLAALQPTGWSVIVSVAALLVPLAMAVADLRRAAPLPAGDPGDRTTSDLAAMLAAAAAVGAIHAVRAVALGAANPAGVAATALTHLLAGAAAGLGLIALRGLAGLSEQPARTEFRLGAATLAAALAVVALRVVMPALSAADPPRLAAAAAFAVVLAVSIAARGRLAAGPSPDGLRATLAALVPYRLLHGAFTAWSTRLAAIAWAAVITGVAWGLAAASGVIDWNFLIATLGVVIVWLLAIAAALAVVQVPALPAPVAFAACLLALGTYQAVVPPPGEGATGPVEAWTATDPSFRALREALRPAAPADPTFYPFLQRHTNLGRDIHVAPVEVRLAPLTGAPAAYRPHVFLFVVDSLRRDYLAPYNPAVTFTPRVAEFAREATVFARAFTRYGATGLSVPSIWVGGMVLHKQYVTPFAPMNSLHALLAHEAYQRWMAWDNVVDVITPRVAGAEVLDATRLVKDFRFCATVDEIRARLDTIRPGGPPVFTWSLSQDVHISAITREQGGVVDGGDYAAFHGPYASRVRRIDGCFGAFVDDLKARGLYDDSVVILTADHGDSLGEDGRWGHAYTIFPEILQVPLLVHLPARLRQGFEADPEGLAFTTDLTPSLHALLGHEVTPPAPFFGRPLFRRRGTPAPPRADGVLLASSYGSVYGWLTDDGRRLYVADGVNLRDYDYELDGSAAGRVRAVSPAVRARGQQGIHEAVERIAEFYRFTP